MSGRSLGDLWRSLGGLWEVSGRSLEVSWRSLGSLWEVSGKILRGRGAPRGIWEVLGSKSGATLSEIAKKFPKVPFLLCVYEDQNHFMLQITIQNARRQRKHIVGYTFEGLLGIVAESGITFLLPDKLPGSAAGWQ